MSTMCVIRITHLLVSLCMQLGEEQVYFRAPEDQSEHKVCVLPYVTSL